MLKRSRSINIIAYWMVLSTLPGIFYNLQHGVDQSQIGFVVAEWLYYILMISCGLGLSKTEEWARKLAVWLFGFFFAWVLYAAYIVVDSPKMIVENISLLYNVIPIIVKLSVIGLFVIAIIWPIVVIQFLTHPKVKMIFHPDFDPIEEREKL